MKELRLKIKRENYNLFKELGDKQAGELIKGMCAYMYDGKPFFTKDPYLKGAFMGIKKEIDEAKQNSRARKHMRKDNAGNRQWARSVQLSAAYFP